MRPSLIFFSRPLQARALQLALTALALLFGLAWRQFGAQIIETGLYETSTRFRTAYWAMLVVTGILAAASLYAWLGGVPRLLVWLAGLQKRLGTWSGVVPLLIAALLIAYPLVLFGFYGNFLALPFPRLLAFSLVLLAATSALAAWRGGSWLDNLPRAALLFGAVYCAATFFNLVNTYPFTLEWSEVSRYYQASLFFSRQVYGVELPLPITHPSRYLLQSLPFLVADSALWLHRLWQALLWVSLPLLTAWLLARRLRLGAWRWLFIAWSFLFLMQGAVFYHLLPCVMLVLWGSKTDKPGRTFAFVAVASIWAGLSRVNWLPVPGALAALLYLLETRPRGKAGALSLRYLWPPLLYGAGGLLVAAATYALYIANSGNPDPGQFGSAFTSALLWQRLMPKSAFGLGVLPGILLVSAPLIAVIRLRLRQRQAKLDAWRWLGILAILAVFFFGGLVVSAKIGGGTNLHNMDAYMVLLWVLAASLALGRYATHSGRPARLALPAWLCAALLAVPLLFGVQAGRPLNLPPRPAADAILERIRVMAVDRAADGSPVLFISQRHLLTFGMVDIPLVPEYEKLFLMEMAISNNAAYLSQFWQDVENQRFAMIVTDPLHTLIYTEDQDNLAAENNAWVENVSRQLLCSYEVSLRYLDLGIEVLEPRSQKCED